MAGIQNWGGWKRVTPEEKKRALRARQVTPGEPPPPPEPKPYPKALVPQQMERIDTREEAARVHEAASRKLARLDTIAKPDPCSLCGAPLGDAVFVLYAPDRTRICRSCRQSAKRCPHCLEVHAPGTLGKDDACSDCRTRACTCCGAPLRAAAHRRERHKGAYCDACFDRGPFCRFCGLPARELLTGTQYPACRFCQASGLAELDDAVAVADRVVAFLGRLDPGFRVPDLPIAFHDPARLPKDPFFAENGMVYVPAGAPEVWLQRQVCDLLSRAVVGAWKRVTAGSPLAAALGRFYRMLWFEHDGHFVAFEDEKRTGLRSGAEFQPLFQAYSRLGAAKASLHLRKLLSGT